MKFRNINEGSDRKFRPGPKTRAEYQNIEDPLEKEMTSRYRDRYDKIRDNQRRLINSKKAYFDSKIEYLKDEKKYNIFYTSDSYHGVKYTIVASNLKNFKKINGIIYNLPEVYTTFIDTRNPMLYVIEINHNFNYNKLLQDKTISLEEFQSNVDTFIEYLIQTIKKINSIIDSNEKVKFNTESFKERLNNSIKLVSESNNIESKVASKKNGKEAYKEYLELQEVFRNYAGKFLDLLGVDNSVTKILLKTQIDLGTAFTSEFNDTEEKKPETPNTNPPPTPPAK